MNRNTLFAIIAVCVTAIIVVLAIRFQHEKNLKEVQSIPILIDSQPGSASFQNTDTLPIPPVKNQSDNQQQAETTQDQARKNDILLHINQYLKFTPTYDARSFGGFNNINLNVTNSSPYKIDEVSFHYKCLLTNGTIWSEHDVKLGPIEPSSNVHIRIPDQSRGANLIFEITDWKSSALGVTGKK